MTKLIRERDTRTHIIVYTTHGSPENELAVLDAGADTFIEKQGDTSLLLAYLKRLGKRIETQTNIPHLYHLSSHTTYNSCTRVLTIDGQNEELPTVEAKFLKLLCAKNQEPADKSFLVRGIWGKADTGKGGQLRKYASLLRSYLKNDPSLQIKCQGGGYVLFTTEEDDTH